MLFLAYNLYIIYYIYIYIYKITLENREDMKSVVCHSLVLFVYSTILDSYLYRQTICMYFLLFILVYLYLYIFIYSYILYAYINILY